MTASSVSPWHLLVLLFLPTPPFIVLTPPPLFHQVIEACKADRDSTGGVVTCVCRNVPAGWGEPCFDKLEGKLAHAMLSIPATKVGYQLSLLCRSPCFKHLCSKHSTLILQTPMLQPQTSCATSAMAYVATDLPIHRALRLAVGSKE
jgi:hypothetical protein